MVEGKIKFEGWGLLEKYLEDEKSFYELASSFDALWDKTWLDAYSLDDRGYEVALPLYESISTQFKKLEELTSQLLTEIPAMEKELFIMHNLYQNFLEPTRRIIYEEIPKVSKEREDKLMFLPQEWIEVSDNLSRIKTYLDYRNGANFLRYWYFIKNEELKSLIKSVKEVLIDFTKNWEAKYSPRGILTPKGEKILSPSEELGFLTFCVVDSYNDDPILPRLLKNKETREILLTEIPEKGLEKVLLTLNKEKKKIEESLMKRTHKEILSLGNSLRLRIEKENFENYAKEILKLSGFLDYLSYVF